MSVWNFNGGAGSGVGSDAVSIKSGRSGKSGASSLYAYSSNPHSVKHYTKGLRPIRIPRYGGE